MLSIFVQTVYSEALRNGGWLCTRSRLNASWMAVTAPCVMSWDPCGRVGRYTSVVNHSSAIDGVKANIRRDKHLKRSSTSYDQRVCVCVSYQIRLIYRQIWMGSRACRELKYLFPPTFCTCPNIVRQVLAGTTRGAIFHPPSVAIFNTEPCWFLGREAVLKLHRYLWSLSEWINHDWYTFFDVC